MIYHANSKEEALNYIDFMIRKWKKQDRRVVNLLLNPALLTFYNFPYAIRRTIYSTNLIEGFNKQLKRWNGNSFFDKFYKVQNFFPYAIPIVLDNEPPRM
ncbi:IS256 family transposase [Enterococcus faecium]|nr:IS256 family transposase [Enterococcus faecium]